MSAIFDNLAKSKQISTWMEPCEERMNNAFCKAKLPPLTYIISNWEKMGVEDSEWAGLPNQLGRLIVPSHVQLEGSVITIPAYKARAIDIIFTHRRDWIRSIPGDFRFLEKNEDSLDTWDAIAVTDTKVGLEVWANERAPTRTSDLGNTAVVVTVAPVSAEIMEVFE